MKRHTNPPPMTATVSFGFSFDSAILLIFLNMIFNFKVFECYVNWKKSTFSAPRLAHRRTNFKRLDWQQ